jgi:hypothetical protein
LQRLFALAADAGVAAGMAAVRASAAVAEAARRNFFMGFSPELG